ncbi:MAG: hypothetical protein J6S74_03165 [Alphaproteobacteria bacterium]|nr:hypothetical protein [Alphaproteobacteria bacterium]
MKKYIIFTLSCMLCNSVAFAVSNRHYVDVFWNTAVGTFGFIILSSILIWLFSRFIYVLKKLLDPVLWDESRELISKRSVKKLKLSARGLLSILAIYEIGIIIILSDIDLCDAIFGFWFCRYEGFQYLVMCVFIPVLIGIVLIWWQEIYICLKRLWYVIKG